MLPAMGEMPGTQGDRRTPGLWRFGAAVLDEQVAGLRIGGRPVELDRSGYDVLLALLQHAGEVVGKDELLQAGWPGRVVSENSLAKAVSRLRHALGEQGAALKAVHGYGYRLAANVAFEPVPLEAIRVHVHEAERLREGDPLPCRPGWRLQRRLGSGAASVIFLARSDAGEQRAIKLATSELGLRSLKRELALARHIDDAHPQPVAVAPVLGWNLAEAPFFLELPYYRDGNLHEWSVAQGGLGAVDPGIRMALCIQLCDTMAALHGIGVIHRDLKPENLYPVAGGEGEAPWCLVLADLGAGEVAAASQLAQLGVTLGMAGVAGESSSSSQGSLLYLAPEVIAGQPPTQRSDVFALGMLLFQMVAGDLRRTLAPGWERHVDDELLRQDIATAAALDPKDRLLDARALAERLRNLPARREALARERQRAAHAVRQADDLARLARWRRHLVVGGAVLAVFLALSLWQQRRTEQARAAAVASAAHADTEAARTRSVVRFLTDDVLRQADPYSTATRTLTLRQAIDRAAGKVATRFPDNPEAAAAIHGTLAAAYEGMNEFPTAVGHYRRQLALLRAQPQPDKAAVARAHVDLCAGLLWAGDVAGGSGECLRARDDYIAAGLEPDRPEVFLALADTRKSQYAQALRRLQPRLERIARSGDDELHAWALWFAGIAYSRLGRLAETERVYAERVETGRRSSKEGSMQLAWGLADHGNVLLALGRETEGKARIDDAIRMFGRVAGPEHPQGLAPRVYLAQHQLALGNLAAARALAAPTFATLRETVGWEHWTIYAALVLVQADAGLGNAEASRRLQRELEAMAEAGDMEANFPYMREPHWSTFAWAHLALGEAAQARNYIDKLRVLGKQTSPSNPLLLAKLACMDSELARLGGDLAEARRHAQACRAHAAAAAPDASPLASLPRRLLARLDAPVPQR